jgi:tetratricopeptide (TPR) repeat protein
MNAEISRLNQALADRYVIRSELGHGGMATVWLADDLRHERPVALKVLRPDVAEALGADRFLREIRITANLNHPHILPLLDSGEADGVLYYAMPYVEGETLRARLEREKQLPVEDAIRIAVQVADALDYAHEHGVIHRDIKPENILLESGHAVVADFGIARAVHAAGPDTLTKTGRVLGTPVYMSPEQMGGESHIDGRADIYALGCVLYEMLVGEPPFTGPTVQVILARKSTGAPQKLRAVRASVPAGVERAIGRALASAPADRFTTGREFTAALASPDRRRIRMIAVAAVLVATVLPMLYIVGLLPGAVRPAAADFFVERGRVLVAEFENATDQPSLGLAVRQAIQTDLEQSGYVDVVERSELGDVLRRMQLPDSTPIDARVAADIASRQGYPAVITGSVIPVGAGYQLSVRVVEAATGNVAVRLIENAADDDHVLEAVQRLGHLARRHLGESPLSVWRSQPLPQVTTPSLEALTLFARAMSHAAYGNYEQAIAFGEQAVTLDPGFAAAHRSLGIWYENTGNPVSAQHHLDLAYDNSRRLLPAERFLVGATHHGMRGQRDSAAHYYRLAIERNPGDFVSLNNLGDIYERLGHYDEAIQLYQRGAEAGGGSVLWLNVASAARTISRHDLADSVLHVMEEQFPNTWHLWYTAAQNAFYAEDEVRLEQIAGEMAAHGAPYPPVFGRMLLASLKARHGQLDAAMAIADTAGMRAKSIGARWDHYRSLEAIEFSALTAGSTDRINEYFDERPELDTLGAAPLFESIALGLLAMGHALAGDTTEAERLLVRIDSLESAADLHALGLRYDVRAAIALMDDRPEESLRLIEQSREAEFGLLRHPARYLLAESLSALGRHREAAAHFDSLTTTYRLNFADLYYYGPILPLAHRRAADAFLSAGDTASAIHHITEFIDLWQDPDSEQVQVVDRARALLASLVGEGRE